MKRKQALSFYLVGTLGQILLVSLLVWLLRAGGVRVDQLFGEAMLAFAIITLVLNNLSETFSKSNSLLVIIS